jgi:hypothetical protein
MLVLNKFKYNATSSALLHTTGNNRGVAPQWFVTGAEVQYEGIVYALKSLEDGRGFGYIMRGKERIDLHWSELQQM